MPCNKIYDNYIDEKKIVSQYSPRDEEVSLAKLEKVGRRPGLALCRTRGSSIDGEGFLATNIMLSSLLLANTGIPLLTLLSLVVLLLTLCPMVSTL